MNYQRIYDQIIDRARSQNRIKSIKFYFEAHHIIPRCMNGCNEKSNLVLLTAREHFICHWLLCRIYPENVKIAFAFWGMCNQLTSSNNQRSYKVSSRAYEEGKKSYIKAITGRTGYWKGKQKSELHQSRITKALTGRTRLEETRIKNRDWHLKYFNFGKYTKAGELVRIYASAVELEKEYDRDYVAKCLRGKQKSHKGFYWKLIN